MIVYCIVVMEISIHTDIVIVPFSFLLFLLVFWSWEMMPMVYKHREFFNLDFLNFIHVEGQDLECLVKLGSIMGTKESFFLTKWTLLGMTVFNLGLFDMNKSYAKAKAKFFNILPFGKIQIHNVHTLAIIWKSCERSWHCSFQHRAFELRYRQPVLGPNHVTCKLKIVP